MTFRWQARGVPTVTTWALRWRRSEGGDWVEIARVVQLPPRRPMWHVGLVRGPWSEAWPETLGRFPCPRAARVHTLRWVAEQLAADAAAALAPHVGREEVLQRWQEMLGDVRAHRLRVPADGTHAVPPPDGWQALRRVRQP